MGKLAKLARTAKENNILDTTGAPVSGKVIEQHDRINHSVIMEKMDRVFGGFGFYEDATLIYFEDRKILVSTVPYNKEEVIGYALHGYEVRRVDAPAREAHLIGITMLAISRRPIEDFEKTFNLKIRDKIG